jgi:threonine synthase
VRVSAAQAIVRGISADGGLFVPEEIPALSAGDIQTLAAMDYIGRAKAVLKLYLTDFTDEEITRCVEGAYASGKFSDEKVAPLVELYPGTHILELWKGPTCAFKDMALQLLPHLLTVSAGKARRAKKLSFLLPHPGTRARPRSRAFAMCRTPIFWCSIPTRASAPCKNCK